MSDAKTKSYVGSSVPRREDEWLLRGAGRFIDDVPVPSDTIHLGFVMSTKAHARIVNIDASAALALPGVIAVLVGEDLAKLVKPVVTMIDFPGYKLTGRDSIAREKVRFVGEHVAVVLAESHYIAQDAIELVRVDYEDLPVAAELEAASKSDAPLVHEQLGDNILFHNSFTTDKFGEAFQSGEFVIKETFRTGRVAGVPIEPRGCVAMLDNVGDSIVLYTSTQIPHLARTGLAEFLDMAESKIRVVTPEVGGGFGTKAQVYPEEFVATALARKYRRAVKWIQDRREDLLTSIHARDHLYRVEAAVRSDGVIAALKVELLTNAGAYSSYPFGCTLETTGGVRMIVGPYTIRNYSYEAFAVATNTCPSGAYRGVAQPSCFLAIEGVMDRIGRRLGVDPAEIRLRNLIKPEAMPYVNVVGVRYDSGSYVASLHRAMELIDYAGFRAKQPKDRLMDGKYRGIGICSFTEISGTGAAGWRARGLLKLPGFDSALIKVEPTGKISVFVSHAASGQGHHTTFAQIAADHLKVDFGDITVIEGDTASAPYGTNTFASRAAVTGGGAIIRASKKVSDKMRRIAAEMLEASVEDVVLRNGRAEVTGVPNVSVSFQQIAETAYSMNNNTLPKGEEYGLEFTDFYDPPLATMANAVHIAQVAVDPDEGRVFVERYVVVHDCGMVINPMIVDGQVHGGMVQGLGEVLMEEIVYDQDGQHLNANLLDYLLPTALDVGPIQVDHIESPAVLAVGGFKGVGEGGVIGAVPSIANAVADALAALNVNVNRIPLRPDYVLGLIRAASPPNAV